MLLASMHDRASVNYAAMHTLNIVFPKVFDIGCFSHTLDHVGEYFKTPILDEFMKGWIGMFSKSLKTKLAWKTKTGLSPPSYSTTQWWSKWEVIKHNNDTFGDVPSLFESEDLPPSKDKITAILFDGPKNRNLQIELAITIDAGESFVKSTYKLEGDGALIFSAYEEISKLQAVIHSAYYPNVNAVAKKLSGNAIQQQQLIDYA